MLGRLFPGETQPIHPLWTLEELWHQLVIDDMVPVSLQIIKVSKLVPGDNQSLRPGSNGKHARCLWLGSNTGGITTYTADPVMLHHHHLQAGHEFENWGQGCGSHILQQTAPQHDDLESRGSPAAVEPWSCCDSPAGVWPAASLQQHHSWCCKASTAAELSWPRKNSIMTGLALV